MIRPLAISAAILTGAVALLAALHTPAEAAECIYCSCDGGQEEGSAYGSTPAEIERCTTECSLDSACEYPISCESHSLFSGLTPPAPVDRLLRATFPNLTCYSLHTFFGDFKAVDWTYNGVFGAVQLGDHLWLWDDIDRYFGNKDKVVTDSELDQFLSFMGYVPSTNCQHEVEKIKVAAYGHPLEPDSWSVTHLAVETASYMPPSETWWESKLGASYRIFHLLDDLSGPAPAYGQVFSCYEKANE